MTPKPYHSHFERLPHFLCSSLVSQPLISYQSSILAQIGARSQIRTLKISISSHIPMNQADFTIFIAKIQNPKSETLVLKTKLQFVLFFFRPFESDMHDHRFSDSSSLFVVQMSNVVTSKHWSFDLWILTLNGLFLHLRAQVKLLHWFPSIFF